MAEFGYALASLSAILKTAANRAAIEELRTEGAEPVWLPLDLLEGRRDVPETWDMTSDGLAAWLAGQLSAPRLIFLKRILPKLQRLPDLVAGGLLDPLTPRFLAQSNVEAWICGPRDLARLGAALADGSAIGRRIEVA